MLRFSGKMPDTIPPQVQHLPLLPSKRKRRLHAVYGGYVSTTQPMHYIYSINWCCSSCLIASYWCQTLNLGVAAQFVLSAHERMHQTHYT